MSVLDSFKSFQSVVNADPEAVKEARRRRSIFEIAFSSQADVVEVVPSGSLARGTHKDPIHDVDLVVVFDAALHSTWGQTGASADDALLHAQERVRTLLGSKGEIDQIVRRADKRNHAVKCFLDDPDDANALTVDVMPALRTDVGFLVPENYSQQWIRTNPEYLIEEVRRRHAEWRSYAGTVRMLKWWASNQPTKIKSLVMETLALDHLPTDSNQPGAIVKFFAGAAFAIGSGTDVSDPAGLCGPIQRDLDYAEFESALSDARDSASAAISAQGANNPASATEHWAKIFGPSFPVITAATGAAATSEPRPVKDTPQG
ncbi:hypothetical protein GCM10027406_13930 [Leifsonia lichenia]